MKKIVLCGRGRCCPTIEKEADGYRITDDFGGMVLLTEENIKVLKKVDLQSL